MEEGNILPDIWLEGRLDADDEVDDNGIFETGEGAADVDDVAVECLGLLFRKHTTWSVRGKGASMKFQYKIIIIY